MLKWNHILLNKKGLNLTNDALSFANFIEQKTFNQRMQNYLETGNDSKLRKYLDEYDFFYTAYVDETLYQELNNDSIFKLLEDGLENYLRESQKNAEITIECKLVNYW